MGAPGKPAATTVALFDQGITQVLQAAVTGLAPAMPYVLALTSKPDGTGTVEPIARFTTNPAGAQIVLGVGPIRQIVAPDTPAKDDRRWLAVLALEQDKPGAVIQVQQ
jgi:hypothetical protein